MRLALIVIGLIATACNSEEKRPAVEPMAEMAKRCTHPGAELSCPVPIFTVRSLKAAQRYFNENLGFKHNWEYGHPATFASVSRAHAEIFLCEGCVAKSGAWMMVFTPDVDKLHKDFAKRKANIKMPPSNMEWGLREMHVEDLDGNVIRFGGPIPK